MQYGKVPPQAKDVEEKVLGALLLEKGAIDIASEILKPESFYIDTHSIIYSEILFLHNQGTPVDILTVVKRLQVIGEIETCGGIFGITKLTNSVTSAAHIESWVKIIHEEYLKRQVIEVGGRMIQAGYEAGTDVFELIEQSESDIYHLALSSVSKDVEGIDKALVSTIRQIEFLREHSQEVNGVTSGIETIDKVTKGWQDSDLIILAARPSVGKTAFALNLVRNAAIVVNPITKKPKPVAIFSLEMSTVQLTQRMLSAESEIPLELIKSGRITDDQMKVLYQNGVTKLAQAPIYIDDTASLTITQLRSKCRRLKIKKDIGLIVVDYLQLMTSDRKSKGGNREQEISAISRELKIMAKDLNVPVIALSQLSREVEKRANKTPQLSDLRESGAIEQDADMVMFLYRPSDEDIRQDASLKDTGMLKIAKHRNGSLEEIPLAFKGWIQKWDVLRDTWQPVPNNYYETDKDQPF